MAAGEVVPCALALTPVATHVDMAQVYRAEVSAQVLPGYGELQYPEYRQPVQDIFEVTYGSLMASAVVREVRSITFGV